MHRKFGCDWEHTAFAFSNTIYAKYELPDHIIEHEKVHLNQQGRNIIGAWIWLALYLCSTKFRYAMELQAYRKQWQFIKKAKHYRYQWKENALEKMAGDLSDNLYGRIVSFTDAKRAIQS